MFVFSSIQCSTYFIVAMTFERFYSIVRPQKAVSFSTVKKARTIIIFIIVFSFTYVTAAGLRASNSRNTSVWPEWIRLGTCRVVMVTRSMTVMEYYFYLGGLTH